MMHSWLMCSSGCETRCKHDAALCGALQCTAVLCSALQCSADNDASDDERTARAYTNLTIPCEMNCFTHYRFM